MTRKVFSVDVWMLYYNNIYRLGGELRQDTYNQATKMRSEEIIEQMKDISQEVSNYLDDCGMFMPKAKWEYDSKNDETWKSSTRFKYSHLL